MSLNYTYLIYGHHMYHPHPTPTTFLTGYCVLIIFQSISVLQALKQSGIYKFARIEFLNLNNLKLNHFMRASTYEAKNVKIFAEVFKQHDGEYSSKTLGC